MNPKNEELTERYQQLWDGSIEVVRNGQVAIDPMLARGESDRRRCLTVLIRPSVAVQQAVSGFLDELGTLEPDQYYYEAGELHVTVLSLFTATVDYGRLMAHYDRYVEAVNAALAYAPSFGIEFNGVTLSREAVMIQGFPEDAVLNQLRDALRRELRNRDLIEGLDGRYFLQTAHITGTRFRRPLRNSEIYARTLESYRRHKFGRTTVQELQLVRNDWYMSRESVELMRKYELSLL